VPVQCGCDAWTDTTINLYVNTGRETVAKVQSVRPVTAYSWKLFNFIQNVWPAKTGHVCWAVSISRHTRNLSWKVGGDGSGDLLAWGGCRSPSFSHPSLSSPSPVVAPPMFHPFPSALFFLSPLNSARGLGSTVSFPQRQEKWRTAISCKSWRGPNSPWSPKLEGRDASHGSHGEVAWCAYVPRPCHA